MGPAATHETIRPLSGSAITGAFSTRLIATRLQQLLVVVVSLLGAVQRFGLFRPPAPQRLTLCFVALRGTAVLASLLALLGLGSRVELAPLGFAHSPARFARPFPIVHPTRVRAGDYHSAPFRV